MKILFSVLKGVGYFILVWLVLLFVGNSARELIALVTYLLGSPFVIGDSGFYTLINLTAIIVTAVHFVRLRKRPAVSWENVPSKKIAVSVAKIIGVLLGAMVIQTLLYFLLTGVIVGIINDPGVTTGMVNTHLISLSIAISIILAIFFAKHERRKLLQQYGG